MFSCTAVDTNPHELLSCLLRDVSYDIANHQKWKSNENMLKLMIIFGSGEDIGELGYKHDFCIKK
jgi:hypothetical protein